jgi:type I restriction enzyme S subunit
MTVALGDVCSIVNGGTPKSEVSEYWNGDLNWITPKEMGKLNSREISSTERKITEKGMKNSSARLLPVNSVILSSRAPIGHLAINKELMATNQGCKGLVPAASLDFEYLYYFLSYSKETLNDMGTGATFKELSGSKLATLKIPLPPLATQKNIVAKLDAVFAEIDKATAVAEANARNAEALFQSSVNEIFDRGGFDWKYYTFDELVFDKLIGLVKNSSEQIEDGKFRYFKMNNISNDNKCNLSRITKVNATAEEQKKFQLMNGDFLFNTRNSVELVGKVCVFEGDGKNDILFNNNIMRVRFKPSINPYFVHFAFFSKKIKSSIENMKTGTTNVAAIYYKELKDLKISVPSLETQNELVTKLLKIHSFSSLLIKNYDSKSLALNKLRQSILKQAFSGELIKE